MKKQRGFTLIELIVVIIILGILSAVAVERYVDLRRDARIGVVDHLWASMRTATTLVHEKLVLEGIDGKTAFYWNSGGGGLTELVLAENVPTFGGQITSDGYMYAMDGFDFKNDHMDSSCSYNFHCPVWLPQPNGFIVNLSWWHPAHYIKNGAKVPIDIASDARYYLQTASGKPIDHCGVYVALNVPHAYTLDFSDSSQLIYYSSNEHGPRAAPYGLTLYRFTSGC